MRFMTLVLCFYGYCHPRALHSFPTRRSSDLVVVLITMYTLEPLHFSIFPTLLLITTLFRLALSISATDRKSTRLNSSHVENSYAVFCLKKKNRYTLHLKFLLVIYYYT